MFYPGKWLLIIIQAYITCDVLLFRPILHKYANEDVTLGSWFLGLEVEHIDDRNFCCGTPPGKKLYIFIDASEVSKGGFELFSHLFALSFPKFVK